MENKIINIDIAPCATDEITENAGVMWEHNATSILFNIDPMYIGNYKYYIEYRSIIGTKVRTEYLELNKETNTVTYDIPVTMTSLRGVECHFNIMEIDDDGQTVKVVKSRKFCLEFDYSPDTDNSLAKVNDFSINALLEAIRLGTFKGEKGDSGEIANADKEMSDTSENAVQNKVIKAYVDGKIGFNKITEECNAWELEDGLYVIDNPNTEFSVYLSTDSEYIAYKGFIIVTTMEDWNATMIYAFCLDSTDYAQSIVGVTVDPDGALISDMSFGYVATKNYVDEATIIDDEMSDKSSHPVKNKVVKAYIDSTVTNKNDIPDYWKDALDQGANEIRQAMETAGRNKSAFLFYSDAHWTYGSQMSPKLLKYLYKNTSMTKTFFGGDIVDTESSDREAMKYLYEWREMIKDLPNHHSVVGNHDDGNSTDKLFPAEYIYSYLLAAEEAPNIVYGDGMYYYMDEPCEKTRYLFLDTAYKGVDDEQIAFVKEALKSTQSGWHIVVIAHAWYQLDYDSYSERPVPIKGVDTNASQIMAILDNYNSRDGEFADCDGWVEFCIGGHVHYDYDNTTSTGIPIILVETDSYHTRGSFTSTAETTTESSVNGIVADYGNHKVHVIRVGRGESRDITVTNYVVEYDNVLPLATDTDGVTIYNGKGYKENTRWSTSSNTEVEAEGVYLSGLIPVSSSGGDIIRLKNVTMDKTVSRGCMIIMYKNIGEIPAVHSDDDGNITAYNSPVWEGNKLVQFTSPQDYSYIRIQGAYIGEDSIITINQEIE